MTKEFNNEIEKSQYAFSLLSKGTQKWVSRQGWPSFRSIQSDSIIHMLDNDDNEPKSIVVSAGTAMGKTEAAFLPALSIAQNYIDENRDENFVYILYVAPLKALINDQYRRMTEISEFCGLPTYIWHGDAPMGQKKRLMKEHSGILMITPESLESFLINRGQWCSDYMTPLCVIVDEFHAFLGNGRGKQLLSLLSRIDALCLMDGKSIPSRIALSATLSQLDKVGQILSPNVECGIIDGTLLGASETELEIKTFAAANDPFGDQSRPKSDYPEMAKAIIEDSIGQKTLTFAKSRLDVETIAAAINDECEESGIDSEAFPHHGSLSKETREELEHRLVGTDKPTMAVATITLELGIDIGDIYKVFQVGSTNSVASLRQRVGRSGRRDGRRKLKSLITLSGVESDMQQELTTLLAECVLMENGWFEPPSSVMKDVSVLISETLSVVSQYRTAYQEELYNLLCTNGAFKNVSEDLYDLVITDMLAADFLLQDETGMLGLGIAGEQEVNDWHFYATFQTEESYSVKSNNKIIGEITPPETSLPLINEGKPFMLGGKYWRANAPIDMKNKVIHVAQTATKADFLVPISRGGGDVNGFVKRKRLSLLSGKDKDFIPDYLDEDGRNALEEARKYAQKHLLNGLGILLYDAGEDGSESKSEVAKRISKGYHPSAMVSCIPPVSSATYDALCLSLQAAGLVDTRMENIPLYRLSELVEACLEHIDELEESKIELMSKEMIDALRAKEKYNYILSDETLKFAYVDEMLDMKGARKWMESFSRFYDSL